MKKVLFYALLILLVCSGLAYAAATSETGDSRAMPMSAYGKTSGGVVTPIQVDSNGAVVISGGGSGGSGVFELADGELQLDTTYSGYNVNIQNNLSVGEDLTVVGNIEAATYGSNNSVSDAELLYIGTLTSDAQVQLNNSLSKSTVLAGDVSGTYGATVVADDSHNHVYSNIDATTSANWAGIVSDELGSGNWLFGDQAVSTTSTVTFGNAIISNGLTVDSSTFVVDEVNNRVGINDATPDCELDVVGDVCISGSATLGSINSPAGSTGIISTTGDLDIGGDITASEVFSVEDIYFPLDFDTSVSGSNMVSIAFPLKDMLITQVRVLADSPIAGDLTVTCYVGATEFTSASKPFVDNDGIGAWRTGFTQVATESDLFKVVLSNYSVGSDLTGTGYLHVRGRGRDRI